MSGSVCCSWRSRDKHHLSVSEKVASSDAPSQIRVLVHRIVLKQWRMVLIAVFCEEVVRDRDSVDCATTCVRARCAHDGRVVRRQPGRCARLTVAVVLEPQLLLPATRFECLVILQRLGKEMAETECPAKVTAFVNVAVSANLQQPRAQVKS